MHRQDHITLQAPCVGIADIGDILNYRIGNRVGPLEFELAILIIDIESGQGQYQTVIHQPPLVADLILCRPFFHETGHKVFVHNS